MFPLHLLEIVSSSNKGAISLKSLHLACCILGAMHPTFNGFNGPSSLTLNTVEVGQTQMECLINKQCKYLERLRLLYIAGVEELKIDGSSSSAPQLALKYIECKSCHDLEKKSIHGAAQLDTFVYIGKSVDSLDLTMLDDVFIFYKPYFVEDGKSDGIHDGCKHIPQRYQLGTLTLSTSIAHLQVKLSKMFLY